MNTQELAARINQHFPGNIGIILTGSQTNNIEFNNISDIDTVVLCRASSDVHSYGINFNGFRIDCTVFPFWDIDSVLENESEHERGILLTMLAKGKMIAGEREIVLFIQQTAGKIVAQLSNAAKLLQNESVIELERINKYFKREINEDEKIILLSELVHVTTKLEVIKQTARNANYLKKVKAIQENNPIFLKELKAVYYKVLIENETELATSFINNYLKQLLQDTAQNTAKNFIAIDCLFNISITEFTENVLHLIQQNEVLHKSYQYFYHSSTKYHRIYKYNYTLVFKCNNNSDELGILSELRAVALTLGGTNLFNYQLTTIPETALIDLNKSLCNLYQAVAVYDIVKQSAILLIHFLSKQLQMDITDLVNLNKILVQKWILERTEQKDLKQHTDIIRIQKNKFGNLDTTFKKIEKNLLEFIISYEQSKIFYSELLTNQIKQVQAEIIKSVASVQHLKKYVYWNDSVLSLMEIEKLHEAKAYLIIIQEIFTMFNLSTAEKAEFIYFSSLLTIQMA